MSWIKHPSRLLLDGEPGKTMFYKVSASLAILVTKPNTMPRFFQKIKATGDDRSYALMAAMVVEHYLDEVMILLIPDFIKFTENHEVSLSQKLDLLRSMRLIPDHIIDCAHMIRSVRNEFAHNVELDSFDSLKQKILSRLRTVYDSIPVRENAGGKSTKFLIHAVVMVAVSGLTAYERNIRLMTMTLRSREFLELMWKKARDADSEIEKLLKIESEKETNRSQSKS